MPNWCDTDYKIHADKNTRTTILSAYNKLHDRQLEKRNLYDTEIKKLMDAGKDRGEAAKELEKRGIKWVSADVWLYYLLLELGFTEEQLEKMDGNMRGYVYSIEDDDDEEVLHLGCETAWSESDGFRHALQEKFRKDDEDTVDILYTAVEPGCEVFITNDPDYDGLFHVDIEGGECSIENADDTKGIIEEHLGKTFGTLDEALKAADEYDKDDNHIWVNEFGYYED